MSQRLLRVKVHADAREDKLVAKSADAFEVWVKAPAERGLANAAVLRLLASTLKVEAKRLWIVKGAHSPAKIVSLR